MHIEPKSRGPGLVFWIRAAALAGLAASASAACTLDPDDRCGPNQVSYGDNERCVCAPGFAYDPATTTCIACRENEISSPGGCVCKEGFVRSVLGFCEEAPMGLGVECDATTPCTDPAFSHCEPAGDSGYCTNIGCTSSADCSGGYACDLGVTPSVCRRPPIGLSMPCSGPADCAGTEATYCDLFVSMSCLVEGCTVSPNDCFEGWDCCDLSTFGIPKPICVPAGACTTQ